MNLAAFGCFVQMEGLRRKVEGLVHISQLRREGRVNSVAEVVNKGDKVHVKVCLLKSLEDSKIDSNFEHFPGA